MMRWIWVVFAVLHLLVVLVSSALAIPVDTLEDIGPDGTPVTIRTVGGVTVNIQVAVPGVLMVAHTYFDSTPFAFGGPAGLPGPGNDPLIPANVSGSRFISTSSRNTAPGSPQDANSAALDTAIPLTFYLSTPVRLFGLTTVDALEDRAPGGDSLTLRAFDVFGAIVDEQTLVGPQGPSGLDLDWLVSSAGNDIVRVQLDGVISDFGGYGIDDLVVDATVPIPEPGTLLLLGSGLTGLAAYRRKKKSAGELET